MRGEARPRIHFEDEFREVEPWRASVDGGSERDQARRFFDLIESFH
jgi:hypothetical protein